MARVNILKQVKKDGKWTLVSIPRDRQGRPRWKDLPEGRYFIEWWENGKRRRQAAGATVAEAKEEARIRKHMLEGRSLGIPGYEDETEEDTTPLRKAVERYLDLVENLKKPNTHRKYKAVLNRFLSFFSSKKTARDISPEDLNEFMVYLKAAHDLSNNSVIHNMVIVAQFLKKQGRPGMTKKIDLPDRTRILPREYTDEELEEFFSVCDSSERVLFLTFLYTGFREKEIVNLWWEDIQFSLNTIRVTAKPDIDFSPKRWEEREVPVPSQVMEELKSHPKMEGTRFVFPSPRGNQEFHMLDKCKAVAKRAKLNEKKFQLRKFRSTYATRMLRAGFDIRTVQHWMGHKSLETTMRYLSPAREIRERLDRVQIAGILGPPESENI